MRKLLSKPNVDGVDYDYPFGKIRDKSPSEAGTPVNEQVYGDMHQFFEKLMFDAGIIPNDLPENEYSGFQQNDALDVVIRKPWFEISNAEFAIPSVGSYLMIELELSHIVAFDVNSNFRLKVYSEENPDNYVIGGIFSISGKTVTIRAEYVSGSGTHNDWVVVPYQMSSSRFNTGYRTSSTNDAFTYGISMGPNGTLSSYEVNCIKREGLIHLNGQVQITTSGDWNSFTFLMKDKWKWREGNDRTYINYLTGYHTNLSNTDNTLITGPILNEVNDSVDYFLAFTTIPTIPTNRKVIMYFQVTYEAQNDL